MPYRGPDFYDDERVFSAYSARRVRTISPNEVIEQPIVMDMIGSLDGLDVLDIGCGDGMFGKTLLDAGANSYLGIDGSANMVNAASSNLNGSRANVLQANIEEYEFGEAAYDLITARLVFHYLPDLAVVLSRIFHALRDGGRLVCSIEHPVLTASNKALDAGGKREDWIVDDYFVSGPRTVSWLGAEVIKYHRTIQNYFEIFGASGLVLKELRESNPDPARFADESEYRRRQRIPLFLMLTAQRPRLDQ